MINRFLPIFILILSCSSLPDTVSQRSTIEKRADQLMLAGDRSRNEDRLQNAKEYYLAAAELYRGKADHQKYLISQIRLADIALKNNSIAYFDSILVHISDVNRIENLNQTSSIDYLKAKQLYHDNKLPEANTIVDHLIEQFDDDAEKLTYYNFLKADHNLSTSKSEYLEELYNDLIDLFTDGDLSNVEILSYCSLVRCKLAVEQNQENSIEKLQQAEQIFTQLEEINQLSKLYGLFNVYYKKNNQLEKAAYYLIRESETKKMLN